MEVQYFAGKRLKIGKGWRQPGDPVPEAAGWKTLNAYVNTGHILVKGAGGDIGKLAAIEARNKKARESEGVPAPVDPPSVVKTPVETQCSATTKSGNPCSRKATDIHEGASYCPQHLAFAKRSN